MKISNYNSEVNFDNNKIIYNTISKASIEVESFDIIKKIISFYDIKNIENLKKLGMIVEDDLSELDTLRYLFNKTFFNNQFLNIVLVPGLDCNFMCPYCFEKVKGNEKLFETNINNYFFTLKKYSNKYFKNYDEIEISLFGGEPLLFADSFFEYFDYINKALPNVKYFSSIVTNGALLTVKMVRQLIKYNCRSIQVTIDGVKEKHDQNRIFKNGDKSYDILIDNINNVVPILPTTCQFNLRINLNNVSVSEVKKTLSDIKVENRKSIKLLFRPIYETQIYKNDNSNTTYKLKSFVDLAIDMGFDIVRNTYYYQACEACSGDNFYFIMPDMSIWKCINDINFLDACVGEINENGDLCFEAKKLVNWYNYSNCFNNEECKKCKRLPDCFGGCVLYKAKNGRTSCKDFDMASLPYLY